MSPLPRPRDINIKNPTLALKFPYLLKQRGRQPDDFGTKGGEERVIVCVALGNTKELSVADEAAEFH